MMAVVLILLAHTHLSSGSPLQMSSFASSAAAASGAGGLDDSADEAQTPFELLTESGEAFTVSLAAAKQSRIIRTAVAGDADARSFQCDRTVRAESLRLIVAYLTHHANGNEARPIPKPLKNSKIQDVLSAWDYEFILPLLVGNCKQLLDLMLAANYLDISPLFEMCCATMAAIMKTKPPEQVAKMLGVDINLADDEWEALRRDNAWAEVPEPPSASE